MGRNSSRIASRRILNSTRDASQVCPGSDDDDDDDWIVDRKRRKRDKNSPRRLRNMKVEMRYEGIIIPFEYRDIEIDKRMKDWRDE